MKVFHHISAAHGQVRRPLPHFHEEGIQANTQVYTTQQTCKSENWKTQMKCCTYGKNGPQKEMTPGET